MRLNRIIKIFVVAFAIFLAPSYLCALDFIDTPSTKNEDVVKKNGNAVKQDEVIVGFLKTAKETYPHEWDYSHNIPEMLVSLGAKVVMIDYNQVVDFKAVKNDSLEEAKKTDINLLEVIEAHKIKNEVEKFIKKKNINRIFIPGNYYNLDSEPFPLTPNRQLVTNAIVSIVHENPKIHLIAVCGGLQGVVYAEGIEIVRVDKVVKSKVSAEAHLISMPDPHDQNVYLHKLRVVPGSRLGKIISKYVTPDQNGWPSLYFPDAHGGVVNNSTKNIKKIEDLGYKIIGFSDDGVIEAVEDKYGNILFQDHPESLAIHGLKKGYEESKTKPERNVSTLAAIEIIMDFLYRPDPLEPKH